MPKWNNMSIFFIGEYISTNRYVEKQLQVDYGDIYDSTLWAIL